MSTPIDSEITDAGEPGNGNKSLVPPVGPCLIEHANRCWEAERENADRVLLRRRSVATAIAVVLGLGLYKVEWVYDPEMSPVIDGVAVAMVIRGVLLVGMLLFLRALYILFWSRQDKSKRDSLLPKQTASYKLAFKPTDKDRPPELAVMRRTYSAYLDLRAQNASEWDKLRRGERTAGFALIFVFSAFAMYVFLAVPPIMPMEAPNDDDRDTRKIEAHGDFEGSVDLRFGPSVEPESSKDQELPSAP